MLKLILATLAICATPSMAQSVMDGSDPGRDALYGVAMREVADLSADPYAAQFRRLSTTTDRSAVCGQVNTKNEYGGYVGFRPFVFDLQSGKRFLPERPFSPAQWAEVGLPDGDSECALPVSD